MEFRKEESKKDIYIKMNGERLSTTCNEINTLIDELLVLRRSLVKILIDYDPEVKEECLEKIRTRSLL